MTEMASIDLFATDAEATAAFYRAIGLELIDEAHDDGPVHFAVELGDMHFAIHSAQTPPGPAERRAGGSSSPGFYASSLDLVSNVLASTGARVLTEHEEMPWGCRIVVEDPDGRPVEVTQRSHCRPD
jgi:predicted enzyme related to lactoylglutathione lyase